MINFRDKWLSTLLLAILLHMGVFFILYINIDNNNLNDNTQSKNSVVNQLTATSIDNEYSSMKTQTYIPTSNKIEVPSKPNSSSIKPLDYRNKTTLESTKKQTVLPKRNDEIVDNSYSRETNYTLNTPSKEKTKMLKERLDSKFVPAVTTDNESLVPSGNDVGLLNMDVPTQKTEVKTDKDFDSVKSEVEKINSQLSDAINEVKKRNQQKIDQMQQDQTYIQDSKNSK